jgi:hypothetical protein
MIYNQLQRKVLHVFTATAQNDAQSERRNDSEVW